MEHKHFIAGKHFMKKHRQVNLDTNFKVLEMLLSLINTQYFWLPSFRYLLSFFHCKYAFLTLSFSITIIVISTNHITFLALADNDVIKSSDGQISFYC